MQLAEVDGNRTRLTRIARDNRFEGGRALTCFPCSGAMNRVHCLLLPRLCPARRSFPSGSFGFHQPLFVVANRELPTVRIAFERQEVRHVGGDNRT
jgi:hypothetical protein